MALNKKGLTPERVRNRQNEIVRLTGIVEKLRAENGKLATERREAMHALARANEKIIELQSAKVA